MKTHEESTYALIIRSEERNRSLLEVVLYAFFILSAIVSFWQFAHQPVSIPAAGLSPSTPLQSVSTDRDCAGRC